MRLQLPKECKEVNQIDVLPEEGVAVALCGHPTHAWIMDVERIITKKPRIKILTQSKGAHLFAKGLVCAVRCWLRFHLIAYVSIDRLHDAHLRRSALRCVRFPLGRL